MPYPTPFHDQLLKRSYSLNFKDWGGYYAARNYGSCHEPEYFAIRHQVAAIDVSPLFKYAITGKDAADFLSYVTVKDIRKLKPGRVTYICWCDDQGKVVDDGTAFHLANGEYRLTAAEPTFSWIMRLKRGFDVEIKDLSREIGALSIQGPNAKALLKQVADGPVAELKFFGTMTTTLLDIPVEISRTGYTGDLGYEIWVDRDKANSMYQRLMEVGADFGLMPVGLDAMDVARLEAGFIMNGVDYFSAHHCLIEERKSSPFELGLSWTVNLERDPFVGQAALMREKAGEAERVFVGLDMDWLELEEVFATYGLPPEVSSAPWRDGRPIYDQLGDWVGQATSGTWSPILKKNIAIGQLRAPLAKEGMELKVELTAEYRRHKIKATVVKTPFFNPLRKRA